MPCNREDVLTEPFAALVKKHYPPPMQQPRRVCADSPFFPPIRKKTTAFQNAAPCEGEIATKLRLFLPCLRQTRQKTSCLCLCRNLSCHAVPLRFWLRQIQVQNFIAYSYLNPHHPHPHRHHLYSQLCSVAATRGDRTATTTFLFVPQIYKTPVTHTHTEYVMYQSIWNTNSHAKDSGPELVLRMLNVIQYIQLTTTARSYPLFKHTAPF